MSVKNLFNAVQLSTRRGFTALIVLLLAAVTAQAVLAGAGSTVMAADIRTGPSPSSPSYMTVFNGELYFAADDGTHGKELMKYDGSSVSLVADINTEWVGADSSPSYLAVYNGALYFQADGGTNGVELWKYTGSGVPTENDLRPGNMWVGGPAYSSDPMYLTVYNGELYFQASDGGSEGYELWKYNSTTDTASLAADIRAGFDSSPQYLAVYNGALYFTADGGTNGGYVGYELWKYDSTTDTATLAAEINPDGDSNPAYLTVYNGALYFRANGGLTPGIVGQELWKFDGSIASLAKDIRSGVNGSSPQYLAVYNGALYFGAVDGTAAGNELWKYDSDSDTAVRVSDINSGGNSGIGHLAVYNGTLYFQAYDSGSNYELWKYSFTAPTVTANSLQVNYTGSGPSAFTVTFSEEVYNPTGNTDADDVTNPANFLLVEKGANKTIDTVSCDGGVGKDDTKVTVASVSYINPVAIVTLSSSLPAGDYRLFVCGTTSIVDLSGNHLNNGVDFTYNLTVGSASASTSSSAKNLPDTGFAPHKVTSLPAQPAEAAYAAMGDLWLEIPSQKVKANIVGVPQVKNNWDVTWLGNEAGWLNGTAFPTWIGNSVITAHVTDANGLPGPFANLRNLVYGDKLIVHLYGEKYTFEVRQSRLVSPNSTSFAYKNLTENSYLTLITCQSYNYEKDDYTFRRVVRAVLISVEAE
jgi:LPXTG-site transpeptidase (sortase) family protein